MINIAFDSQIFTALMACPRYCNFRFAENLVVKGGKGNSLECGSLAHAILEHFNKAIINGKSRNEAVDIGLLAGREYIEGYRDSNKYITDQTEKGMVNTPKESYREGSKEVIGWQYVLDTMVQYFDHWRNETWTILGAEEVRREIIYEDEDIRVLWKAKFDQIVDSNAGIMSVDHKTSKKREDIVSMNNQFMGQCVLMKNRNVVINKIGWQKTLKPEEKFTREIISYSPDRLAEWANEIVPHYARMYIAFNEAGYWPPNFLQCETKYGKCGFYIGEVCTADRHMRNEVINMHFEKGKVWDVSND